MASPIVGKNPDFVPTVENQTEAIRSAKRAELIAGIGTLASLGAMTAATEIGNGNGPLTIIFGAVAVVSGLNMLIARVHERRSARFVRLHSSAA